MIKELIQILILAMMPISECRGSIPLAILGFGFDPILAYIVSIIGNIIPIPFIYIGLDLIKKYLVRFDFFNNLAQNAENKIQKITTKYKKLGIFVFVAIPLPYTGIWTATLGSYLIGLKLRDVFIYEFLGVIVSGIIVTILVLFFNVVL